MDTIPGKSISLFSHILNTHHIWNARLIDKKPKYDLWQSHAIENWEDIHYENQRTSFEIVTNTTDFEKRIDYENSKGRLYANTLSDVLFHINNHSTHHRGQILMDFRNNGITPSSLDYIFYKR